LKSDNLLLTITDAPVVSVVGVADTEICSDSPSYVIAGATALNESSVLWSTAGDGTFVNNTILNPTYVPGAADRASATVTLTITAFGNGSCASVPVNLILNITPAAAVSAGVDAEICGTGVYTLGGSFSNSPSAQWSTSGTGSFNGGGVFGAATTYTPGAADITAGTVTLTLTTGDPAGECGLKSDNHGCSCGECSGRSRYGDLQ
jgi:hypothetical protein